MHVCHIYVDSVDTRYVCKEEAVSVQDRTELRSGEGFAFIICAWLERSVEGDRVGYVFALMDKRCAGVFETEYGVVLDMWNILLVLEAN